MTCEELLFITIDPCRTIHLKPALGDLVALGESSKSFKFHKRNGSFKTALLG